MWTNMCFEFIKSFYQLAKLVWSSLLQGGPRIGAVSHNDLIIMTRNAHMMTSWIFDKNIKGCGKAGCGPARGNDAKIVNARDYLLK